MEFREFEIEEEEGYIRAYVVENTLESLASALPNSEVDLSIDKIVEMNFDEFIYLEEIFIYPEFRRQGFALKMMTDFLEKMEDEDLPILLIAGGDYTPKDMDIIKFYEDFGFDILMDIEDKPLMIR